MKKKVLLVLCLFAIALSFTACNSKNEDKESESVVERESKKYQEGFKEGKYSIRNLTFTLPDVYKSEGNNRYSYISNENGIMVAFYVDTFNNKTLNEYISDDKYQMYPIINNLEETIINGNHFLKGKSKDNDTLYYIKDGNDFYLIALSPLFTTTSVFNELVTTLENSLYFK